MPNPPSSHVSCRRLVQAIVLSTLLLAPTWALGQRVSRVDVGVEKKRTRGTDSPYRVNLAVDIPLTAALVGASSTLVQLRPDSVEPSCYPCSEQRLNVLDQTAVGNDARWAREMSDWGVYTAVAAPFAVGFLEAALDGDAASWKGFLVDSLVVTQAIAAAMTLNQVFKMSALRPRPVVYADRSNPRRIPYSDSLSFYSGHTAMAFAGAVGAARTYSLRHPEGSGRAVMWSACLAVASATAVGRVLGGRHFWSDVVVGAVAGSAAGWLVPTLHLKREHEDVAPDTPRVHFVPTGVRVDF